MSYPDWQRGPGYNHRTRSGKLASVTELHPRPKPEQPHHRTQQAIDGCTLCDDDGYQGGIVCDHVDRHETYRRGMEAVRAALRKDQPGR